VTIKKKRKTTEENKSEKVLEVKEKVKDEKKSTHLQKTPEKKKSKIDGVKKLLKIIEKKKK
jgi:hypothetical protein